jgi:Fe2+ transport system protein FeoA
MPGREVVLCRLTLEPARRYRLAERGFVPGARLRLVARGPAGGLVVAVGDTRTALDARTAAAIVVERP